MIFPAETLALTCVSDTSDPYRESRDVPILITRPDCEELMDKFLLAAMENVVDDLYGHVHRVASLACGLGRGLGLTEHEIDSLALVGILHDVGKVHIDPAVLAKPGPLDDLERDHMRRHPELGYAMIGERFDRRVSQAILYHHERYDGGGYPYGLSGLEIPTLSRIVLVADAFDAITNHRSYQPALSVDFAIHEISSNSGTQFDPAVVEAFMSLADTDQLPPMNASLALEAEAV